MESARACAIVARMKSLFRSKNAAAPPVQGEGQPATAAGVLAVLRLERAHRRWRLLAIVLALLVGALLSSQWEGQEHQLGFAEVHTAEPYIARVDITGMVFETDYAVETLHEIAKSSQARALLVHIDSPGGTMTGGINLFQAIRAVAESGKPVAVSLGTTAASAGYLIALAGDYIVANEATLTGSIGVFLPLFDATGLAGKIGIRSEDVVSGDKKVITSPLHQRNAEDRAVLQNVVNALNDVFYGYIATRRPALPAESLAQIRDGRILAGVQAYELGLVDALGNAATAYSWLDRQLASSENPPAGPLKTIEIELEEPHNWWGGPFGQTAAGLGRFVGQVVAAAQSHVALSHPLAGGAAALMH